MSFTEDPRPTIE